MSPGPGENWDGSRAGEIKGERGLEDPALQRVVCHRGRGDDWTPVVGDADRSLLPAVVATRTGFEPVISALTGQYVNRYTTGPQGR